MNSMRQVNLLPNMITTFGLSCGLFVIFKAVLNGVGTYELLLNSIILIMIAAVADVLDGAVARAMHAESEFGVMFDSLSDVITFGVAPSILLLRSLDPLQGGSVAFFVISSAMLYTICGVLRLVRFNVKSIEDTEREEEKRVKKTKMFIGLPIPAAAGAATSLNLLFHSPYAGHWFILTPTYRIVILTSSMVLIGYLMISRWCFPSLKNIHFRTPSFHLVFLGVLSALLILYGVLYFFPLLFVAISWGYIVIGFSLTLRRFVNKRRRAA